MLFCGKSGCKTTMRLIVFSVSVLLLVCIKLPVQGQTIVSTQVENKRAVLEYIKGIYCVYCPEADEFAAELQAIFGEAFIPINIYAGDYAYPVDPYALDLRSDFGQNVLGLTNLIGYPAGMVNRRNFPGLEQGIEGTLAINRDQWQEAVQQIIDEPSPVNIAMEAQYDIEHRELEVLVEVYYTADVDANKQRLHIAIIQDSIRTLQAGSSLGFNYFHPDVLRDMITEEEGFLLGSRAAGDFVTQSFQFDLPLSHRGAKIVASDIELVAFIAESKENILTGTQHKPAPIGTQQNDTNLIGVYEDHSSHCEPFISPTVVVQNDGSGSLHNIRLSYAINGETAQILDWSGQLKTFEKKRIEIPPITYTPSPNPYNELEINLIQLDNETDGNLANNHLVYTFDNNVRTEWNQLKLELGTDNFGYETYWEVVNMQEEVIVQGGNFLVGLSGGGKQVGDAANPGAYPNNEIVEADIELPGPGCYTLRFIDDYGDGFCCSYGDGFYRLRDDWGNVLVSGNRFGVTREVNFEVNTLTTSVEEVEADEALSFAVFPNPVVEGQFQLKLKEGATGLSTLCLRSATGQVVRKESWTISAGQNQSISINTESLLAGVYFLTLQVEDRWATEKVTIIR